ncbi:LacI family DNA-binding transcriptional regulator [Intrasporangium sp. YIM S08009]|uniref:LacI family DNA-binding transcriptional regulator n=1 Tax=Intrasporangium zincisolvens TaxID=3080018 RepID=UPI002B05C984|nr:LacI family DNA-binding transcriptional regulator [Intrasporangium sp. YIM S08009]
MPTRPPRPRLDDVAARAGVSTASVSLVLRGRPGPSDATREAVLRAASDLGYRPDRTASLLARHRTQLLGVTMDVSSPFQAELLEDLQAAADERGYDLVVSPLTRTRDERRAVEMLLDFRCEALILLGPSTPDADLAALARDHHVVALGRRLDVEGVDVVRAADDVGVGLAVDHLAGLGHRSLAFVDGPRGSIATLRRRAFRAATRRVPDASARVVSGGATEEAGQEGAAGLVAAGALDGDGRVTGLVCYNDRAALGALAALQQAGRVVPGDVSVVGYDDSPLARLATVGLTSVSQATRPMAVAAVQAATQRLDEGRSEVVEVVLEPHLEVRRTTGPVGAQR